MVKFKCGARAGRCVRLPARRYIGQAVLPRLCRARASLLISHPMLFIQEFHALKKRFKKRRLIGRLKQKTVAGVIIDFGVGKALSKTERFMGNKVLPKNDSTYKHTLSTRHSNITRQEVYRRMRFRGTVARGIHACTRFSAYSVRAALPV